MQYKYVYTVQKDWTEEDNLVLDKAVLFANEYNKSNFFQDVCLLIFETFAVDFVLVGRISQAGSNKVQGVELAHKGKLLGPLEYCLDNTPCENIVRFGFCYYPFDVQQLFPEDVYLHEFGVESYMGTPLNDADSNMIGLICLMHSSTIARANLIETFLTILSPRIEEELQKVQAA